MKKLVAAVALALLVASPALAGPYRTYGLDRPWVGPRGEITISAARATALRQCSALMAQYPEYEWGSMGRHQYAACMAGHGQVE